MGRDRRPEGGVGSRSTTEERVTNRKSGRRGRGAPEAGHVEEEARATEKERGEGGLGGETHVQGMTLIHTTTAFRVRNRKDINEFKN